MAKKFFCGSCGHEVVHEVFEEGNCLSCRILLSGKLKSVSDGREPVSYSKDTQTPPDGNGDMHRFIRALLLRRPDAAIDKAVKENRWKDAYELEIKYHMEAAISITSDGPVRFADPPTHPESKSPSCTSYEYVGDRTLVRTQAHYQRMDGKARGQGSRQQQDRDYRPTTAHRAVPRHQTRYHRRP